MKENVVYDCQVISENIFAANTNEPLRDLTSTQNTTFTDYGNTQNQQAAVGSDVATEDFLERCIINTGDDWILPEAVDEIGLVSMEQTDSDLLQEVSLLHSNQSEQSEILHEEDSILDRDKINSERSDPDYEPDETDNDSEGQTTDQENLGYSNNTESSTKGNEECEQTKRKRKHVAQPEEWQKNKEKMLRMKGREYIGFSRTNNSVKQNIKRPARRLDNTCNSVSFCEKTEKRKCAVFPEADRKAIFDSFWDMSWEQKQMYVVSLVSYVPKKRCYVEGPSRRSGSYIYQLRLGQDRLQVCKKMFLSTLGLKEKMVHKWVLKSKEHGLGYSVEVRNEIIKKKRSTSSFVKGIENQKTYLRSFLDLLPKMDSHYCRKDSKKKYFEYPFKTKAEIYKIYTEKCNEEEKAPLSIFTFNQIFDELNLSLFKPRKDQCDICCQYKVNQLSEEDYQKHLHKKDTARDEKTRDKERAIKGEVHVFTMDVQAVKLCPILKAGGLYFKRRLQVHNFTLYNLATHQSKNYMWNETEGDLQSSSFVTCIISHLQKFLTDSKPIILFSDGCGYQNRNNVLANALSLFSVKNGIEIEQKFLEKGHTQMECDSTHALIERRLEGRLINLPSEFISVIQEARKKPFPLEVEYVSHEFFKKYDDKRIMRYDSIRPGKVKNDPTVSDLRALKYLPDGTILYKTDYKEEYKVLPQRSKPVSTDVILEQLHKNRIPIDFQKWKHLQELKPVLSPDTHTFYDFIPHKPEEKKKVKTNNSV